MKRTLSLIRALLKGGTRLGTNRKTSLVVSLLVLAASTPVAFSVGTVASAVFRAAATVGVERGLLAAVLGVVGLMIFWFGIAYVVNVFYFVGDLDRLLPLPLSAAQILAAKFAVVLLYEYGTGLVFVLPVLIAYGAATDAGLFYYPQAIAAFVLIPVVPLVAASILVMIIMRFSNLARNKDLFRIVGGTAAVFLGVGVHLLLQRFFGIPSSAGSWQERLSNIPETFWEHYASFVPGAVAAARFLAGAASGGTTWMYFLEFSLISLLSISIFILLGNFLYFRVAMTMSGSASRRTAEGSLVDRMLKRRSAVFAYFVKELRLLLRTPVFFLNYVLGAFLWPILFLLPFASQTASRGALRRVEAFIENPEFSGIALSASLAFFLFAVASNNASSTAISRDGRAFAFNKHVPVPYARILSAKLLPGVILSLATQTLLMLAMFPTFRPPVSFAAAVWAVGAAGAVFLNLVGLWIDLLFPKLNWDNEQQAVKQNWNVLLTMLVGFVLGGIVVVWAVRFRPDLSTAALTLSSAFGLADLALFRLLMRLGPRRMANIE